MSKQHTIKIEQVMEPPFFGRFKVYIDGEYRGSAGTKQQAHRMAREMVRDIEARMIFNISLGQYVQRPPRDECFEKAREEAARRNRIRALAGRKTEIQSEYRGESVNGQSIYHDAADLMGE